MNKLSLIKILESNASKEAEKLGLTHKGFGNYANSSGKVVARSEDGQLVKINKKLNSKENLENQDGNSEESINKKQYEEKLFPKDDKKKLTKIRKLNEKSAYNWAKKKFNEKQQEIINNRLENIISDNTNSNSKKSLDFIRKLLKNCKEKVVTNDGLHRGMFFGSQKKYDKFIKQWKIGKKISIKPTSWSLSKFTAGNYASGINDMNSKSENSVILHIIPGKNNYLSGISTSGIMGEEDQYNLEVYNLGKKYQIKKMKKFKYNEKNICEIYISEI